MTAQVIDFRPRGAAPILPVPRLVPIDPWWSCPSWCDPEQCIGGGATDFGNGIPYISCRHHNRVIYIAVSGDGVGNEVHAKVEISVIEDPEDGWTDPPSVDLDVSADLDADAAEQFAAAVVYAAALARQPLPATSPRSSSVPSSGGDRATNPLESA